MITFYPLTLADVRAETAYAVSLRFTVPPSLREQFSFVAGQFVTLRAQVAGKDIRRSYSICSTPHQYANTGTFEVGVKHVKGGAFSGFAQGLQAGQALQVLPAEGRFVLPKGIKSLLCVAAGSGITPVLSVMSERLMTDEHFTCTLLYGNKNTGSTMFLEHIQALKNRYPTRFDVHFVMSKQLSDIDIHNGRIDAAKVYAFFQGPLKQRQYECAMVCGPNELIDMCEGMLPSMGVGQVLSERFGSSNTVPQGVQLGGDGTPEFENLAALTIVANGLEHTVDWTSANPLLLDAGLAAGLDLPYACKGGVCCTCRAKVLEGTVEMDKNYTLEPYELEAGFVLTCQCRPTSAVIKVSYDEH